jgi:hypothetical protein
VWTSSGVHLVVVTCSRLAVALASMAEGEMVWHLLSWEELLSVVWPRRSAGCGRGELVEFLLCRRVALLLWLDHPGCRCGGCSGSA